MTGLIVRAWLALCLSLFAFAASAAEVEKLRISGSNTLGAQLIPVLVNEWLKTAGYSDLRTESRNPSVTWIHAVRDGQPLVVEIYKRGSATGMQALIDGEAELAMMSRRPNARELDNGWQLGDLSGPEQEFVLAIDGVVAVVSEDNPVRAISKAQLRDLYAGKIRNWSQLGGRDAPIRARHGRLHSASVEFFRDSVMGGDAVAGDVQVDAKVPAVKLAADDIAILPLRSRLPAGSRLLSVSDGGVAIAPTRLNILSEDYPLLRRYSLYGGKLMSALGRSFALFTMTSAAQRAVARANHIAVMLRPAPQSQVVFADAKYRKLVAGAQRLPISLRFNLAGTQSLFDSRAAQDLERLVAFMRLPINRNRHAVLVAFGSAEAGSALISIQLSNERVDLVADYLHARGVNVSRAQGFGSAFPLASAGRADTRFRNERVEVWVL